MEDSRESSQGEDTQQYQEERTEAVPELAFLNQELK